MPHDPLSLVSTARTSTTTTYKLQAIFPSPLQETSIRHKRGEGAVGTCFSRPWGSSGPCDGENWDSSERRSRRYYNKWKGIMQLSFIREQFSRSRDLGIIQNAALILQNVSSSYCNFEHWQIWYFDQALTHFLEVFLSGSYCTAVYREDHPTFALLCSDEGKKNQPLKKAR